MAGPAGPLGLWVAAAAVVFPAGQLGIAAAAVAAGGASIAALALLRTSTVRSVITAVAVLALVVPAAVWSLASAAVLAASAAVAVATALGARAVVLRRHDPQRHLEWCRRRQERAQVLVLRYADSDRVREQLLDAFRVTDSVTIAARNGLCEVQAVVDDHNLSRDGLERRLLELTAMDAELGWAVFPEDGVTLEVLIESARRAAAGGNAIRAVRPFAMHRVTAAELQTEPT